MACCAGFNHVAGFGSLDCSVGGITAGGSLHHWASGEGLTNHWGATLAEYRQVVVVTAVVMPYTVEGWG